LPETLELAVDAAPGSRAARDLVRAQGEVAQGRPLSGAWRDLPDEICKTLSTSEHAGELAQAATRTASELRFSAKMRRERSGARLPVWMMLAVGLIVGMRVLNFYSALYRDLPL
jgi:type II secretory pathway component PulF